MFTAITSALLETLFEAEDRRLNKILIQLNQDNKKLRDSKVDGFLYLGLPYLPKGISTVITGRTQCKQALHAGLVEAMERYLEDRLVVKEDRGFIQQTLFQMTRPCKSVQDLRDTLPECLVNLRQDLARYPRTRNVAWTIQDNPRALRQYEKILPRIEFYSATRLIY